MFFDLMLVRAFTTNTAHISFHDIHIVVTVWNFFSKPFKVI
jgi:hypothetical protein